MPAVEKRGEKRRVFGIDVIPVPFELQLVDDAWLEQAGEICAGGYVVARPELLGYRAASHHPPLFEHQDAPSRARQVSGRDESVMACAHYDDVVLFQVVIVALWGWLKRESRSNAVSRRRGGVSVIASRDLERGRGADVGRRRALPLAPAIFRHLGEHRLLLEVVGL